jgi:hypothetical protein
MASNLGDANAEVVVQTGLLEQIMTALEGKAAGSGGYPVYNFAFMEGKVVWGELAAESHDIFVRSIVTTE